MGVRRGTATPSKVYRGTVPVKKIMRGTVEVWSASLYPLSGTWESALAAGAATFADHTIVDDGSYTITHAVTGGGQYVVASISGPWGTTNGNTGTSSTVTTTQTLAAGDLIKFQSGALLPSGTATGTWSIVKN